MNLTIEVLADSARVEAAVRALADEIDAKTSQPERVAFVGIHTHGVPLADRLKEIFDRRHGVNSPSGTIDITLYRDDYDLRGVKPRLQSSRVRFPVDGTELILVDDVLFTGRTIRAAIESLGDYGRPAAIRLAVLVDRGHRELPIQPDATGMVVETRKHDRVRVKMKELDGLDEVTLLRG